MNKLYYGDNLEVLREKIESNMVDLIYLDPPFQSGKNYNIIFKPKIGEAKGATAQNQAFEDTWSWESGEAEKEYSGLIQGTITKERPSGRLIELMKAMRGYLGENNPIMAYLAMMAPRLLETKRVLKDTGSIYLHCDPTASHYLKLLMDAIFGPENFRNEIIWCYAGGGIPKKDFPRKHDVILRYTKTDNYLFNIQYRPYGKWTKKFEPRHSLTSGGEKLKEEGTPINDWWSDFTKLTSYQKEWIGYPTQKPEALLERIIKASSNEGDLVLDPFCGCGTTVAVAQGLNRKWIGIDITLLAIDVIKERLIKSELKESKNFVIEGIPADEHDAIKLAESNPLQFQYWTIKYRISGGIPNDRKTGDKGIDGIIYFTDISKPDKTGKAIISVKGGKNINPSMVRDLVGTIQSNNAEFGILITQVEPTKAMKIEAVKQGYFQYVRMQIPKVQIISVKDLFADPIPLKLPEKIIPVYNMKRIKSQENTLPGTSEDK